MLRRIGQWLGILDPDPFSIPVSIMNDGFAEAWAAAEREKRELLAEAIAEKMIEKLAERYSPPEASDNPNSSQ
jgi:hypothetical protein